MTRFYDRRKTSRFKVKEGVFAAHYNSNIRGQLVNISKSGLAFRYIDSGKDPEYAPELIVYLSGEKSYLFKLPVKIVSDVELTHETRISYIRLRQRCIQFNSLNDSQEHLLNTFINTYTDGEVPDRRAGKDRRDGLDRRTAFADAVQTDNRDIDKPERRRKERRRTIN